MSAGRRPEPTGPTEVGGSAAPSPLTRRGFLGLAAGGALASVALGPEGVRAGTQGSRAPLGSPRPTPESDALRTSVRLGVASYSLRRLDRAGAIAAVRALGTPYVNLKSFHQPYEDTPEDLRAGRKAFEDAGLQIVGGGTITLDKDDDDDIRSYFEYARLSGMPLMVIAPTRKTLPRIEGFVQEYDIRVAIHNHGPEDEHFPGPQDVLPAVQGMDPRVGLCLDVGHTARTGIDVVEAVAMAGDRLLDMHMKDLADLAVRESQCIVGEGRMPVPGIFEQLASMEYGGYVNLEYEIDPDDPLPGMLRSFAYMRGVLAAQENRG